MTSDTQGASPCAECGVSEPRGVSGKCLHMVCVVVLLNEWDLGLPAGCGLYIPGDVGLEWSQPEHPALSRGGTS